MKNSNHLLYSTIREFDQDSTATNYIDRRAITKVSHPTIIFLIHLKLVLIETHMDKSSRVYQPCTLAYTSCQSCSKGISTILLRIVLILYIKIIIFVINFLSSLPRSPLYNAQSCHNSNTFSWTFEDTFVSHGICIYPFLSSYLSPSIFHEQKRPPW